ncbi:profilin-1-like [Hyla sarda]|uniref:profilin-1-like n=1 Tax=Hyla sarda TaxID=327740 RepID=UPI0024C3B241|nr:profilin-1-like [Hyla sarda]
MSWDDYIKNLVGPDVQDAVICGFNPCCVWAAHPCGSLSKITPAEIAALAAEDRTSFYTNGLTLGGVRCSLIRDNINDSHTMDVRTKASEGPTYNITIGKTNSAFVIVMGGEGIHGGTVNSKAHAMTKYLRERNM